jgi:hypothetical protein
VRDGPENAPEAFFKDGGTTLSERGQTGRTVRRRFLFEG